MKGVSPPKMSAVILAAGLSSRMKAFKPLLPIGDKTMVEKAIDLFKDNQIADIFVVTGHNRSLLEPVVVKAGAVPVFNPKFQSGMLSSVQKGIQHIRPDHCGFFLLPVDIPGVRPSTIKQLLMQFEQQNRSIIMPIFDDMPGHPPIIPSGLITDISGLGSESTLRDLLLSGKNQIRPLRVHDRAILMDADDPDGYTAVREKMQSLYIPDRQECLSIINEKVPDAEGIRAHLADVAFAAVKIAHAVSDKLDTALVEAAAWLHDILRMEKNHAASCAQLLEHFGFNAVSQIVAQHMDIELDLNRPLQEKEVVYFADKLCSDHGIDLNYHKRFADSLIKSPWAMTNISKRYEDTQHIQARIETSAGKSIKKIFSE